MSASCIGQALKKALGDKRGIRRYGAALLPMDEALAEAPSTSPAAPSWPGRCPSRATRSARWTPNCSRNSSARFAFNAGITLHVTLKAGTNAHHVAEACFKALARALRVAVEPDPRAGGAIPSTKGVLEA